MGFLFMHWTQRQKGVDLVDCNAVRGGHIATSIDQSVKLEEYKQSASVQLLL